MGKQTAFKKIKFAHLFEDAKDLILQRVTGAIVIIIFIISAFLLIKAFLRRSDYFKVRNIDLRSVFLDQRSLAFTHHQLWSLYKGKNIFTVNLKSAAASLQDTDPDAKDVVVRIAPPDKLVVDMKFRKPVAIVRSTKDYPVDEDGFVLSSIAAGQYLKDLPVIEGVYIKYEERRGKKSVSKNLKLALELLSEIKKSNIIERYGVSAIDAKDLRNISLYLKNGLEIRMGSENFKERLETLKSTLKDPRLAVDKIKYIDLRFENVVIGPKS